MNSQITNPAVLMETAIQCCAFVILFKLSSLTMCGINTRNKQGIPKAEKKLGAMPKK
jgi:hypothetical protein